MKKSYTMKIPTELDGTLRELAGRRSMTVQELIRRGVTLVLLADKYDRTESGALACREGDDYRDIDVFGIYNAQNATATPGAAEGE